MYAHELCTLSAVSFREKCERFTENEFQAPVNNGIKRIINIIYIYGLPRERMCEVIDSSYISRYINDKSSTVNANASATK